MIAAMASLWQTGQEERSVKDVEKKMKRMEGGVDAERVVEQ